jgi:cytochrome c556
MTVFTIILHPSHTRITCFSYNWLITKKEITMKNIFNKLILAALSVALVLAAFPVTGAFAQGENPPKGELTNEKLEQVWARQLTNYEKIGKGFTNSDSRIAKFQARLDKAKSNGKDVAALQSALNAFGAALKNAKPIYDSMGSIVSSHSGFDASGKVTDSELAKTTVKEMRTKMQELKSAMGGTGKALREAMKAFREANKPADTSKGGGV